MFNFARSTMLALTASTFLSPLSHARELPSFVEEVASAPDVENAIIVPFQGTWVQGPNTFIFTAGSNWNGDWIVGSVIGGGGQVNQYQWSQTSVTTGIFYFDTTQGRQGPIYVTLSNSNKTMTWRFGAEVTILTRVN